MPPRHLRLPDHAQIILRRLRMVILLAIAVLAATPAISCAVNRPASSGGTDAADAANVAAQPSAVDPAAVPGRAAQQPATPATPATPAKPASPPAPPPPAQKQLPVDFRLQITPYYCAPASTRIALSARGVAPSQDQLASELHTTVNGTDSAYDTTRVLNGVLHTNFYRTHQIPGQMATPAEMDQLQADTVHAISNGYAVVANILGQAVDQSGVVHAFMGGHYIAIVGYGDQGRSVKIADPSGMGPAIYWMSTINAANWIALRGYSA
ncbi:MAG: C39 family peptidase [Micromonosporaceae bacterium]|nr:C39 family peptidase [Micromonosporaceae bacterium]